ncbi:Wzz/FepE/Etk N-terminal domain-containing protein [Olsenella uli]|uniref:YveK family protein n=1 Tax=Olsenella uli TaxID=133926 RepID=UPI0012ABF2F5|nr:Wzz/FepE/Etk N-terminal domain-containing protein [Olsenella uli]
MTLLDLLHLMRKHLGVVIALPVACAATMAAVSFLLLSNTYTADTTLYVQAKGATQGTSSNLYSDLNAGQMIANDVASLADSESVLDAASAQLGITDLKAFKISVSSESTTRVIKLSVTGKDPRECSQVANAVGAAISKVAQESMGVQGVNVIDEAKTPTEPSGPNRKLYTAVAFLGGLFVAVAGIVLVDMVNTKIRGVDDAEETLGVPVIGRIPLTKTGR